MKKQQFRVCIHAAKTFVWSTSIEHNPYHAHVSRRTAVGDDAGEDDVHIQCHKSNYEWMEVERGTRPETEWPRTIRARNAAASQRESSVIPRACRAHQQDPRLWRMSKRKGKRSVRLAKQTDRPAMPSLATPQQRGGGRLRLAVAKWRGEPPPSLLLRRQKYQSCRNSEVLKKQCA